MADRPIGFCPHCSELLFEKDIDYTTFRGVSAVNIVHYAYTCLKCKHIIGFSSP